MNYANSKYKHRMLMITISVIIVAAMVGASELMSDKEIIFPEIAAITVGCFISPEVAWNVSKLKMFIFISICAVSGVLIVTFMPGPLWVQISVAFIIGQFLYTYSRTTFAPMISAIVLPVLLQTRSLVYIVSSVVLTGVILIVFTSLERLHVNEKLEYSEMAEPQRMDVITVAMRVICVSVLSVIVLNFDMKFCIAPPLLVAFTEFTRDGCKARLRPVKAVVIIICCALSGVICRMLFAMYIGLPLFVAAVVTMITVVCIMYTMNMYIPPAGAMSILAMLIPEQELVTYPIQVAMGVSVLIVIAIFVFPLNIENGVTEIIGESD